MSIFRHIMFLQFKEAASEAEIEAFYAGLASMPAGIDVIRRYEFGPNVGLADDRYDMALVADFDSAEDWHRYANHPKHLEFIENAVKPVSAGSVRAQYLID